MRTKKLSKDLKRTCKYVYEPTDYTEFVNVDGVPMLKTKSQIDFNSQFRVSDFKIQTMLDAGVDPKSLEKAGFALLPVDQFAFFDQLENYNIVEPKN